MLSYGIFIWSLIVRRCCGIWTTEVSKMCFFRLSSALIHFDKLLFADDDDCCLVVLFFPSHDFHFHNNDFYFDHNNVYLQDNCFRLSRVNCVSLIAQMLASSCKMLCSLYNSDPISCESTIFYTFVCVWCIWVYLAATITIFTFMICLFSSIFIIVYFVIQIDPYKSLWWK